MKNVQIEKYPADDSTSLSEKATIEEFGLSQKDLKDEPELEEEIRSQIDLYKKQLQSEA